VALLRAVSALESHGLKGDEAVGVEIVRRSLEMPLRQIAENAGVDGAIAAAKVKEAENEGIGFDAAAERYTDMMRAGIIDATKVVRCALQNAASVAGLLLTTEALVAEIPEKKEKAGPPGGPYGEEMY